jgi:hypothetical protein
VPNTWHNATRAEEWPIFGLLQGPPQSRWEVIVQPVPRILRHRINQYILETALPQVARWLDERANLVQRGCDLLAFFYDEKTEEFISRPLTRLEPVLRRAR